jgi:hypothetical protein
MNSAGREQWGEAASASQEEETISSMQGQSHAERCRVRLNSEALHESIQYWGRCRSTATQDPSVWNVLAALLE